jgi:hypothetical protein
VTIRCRSGLPFALRTPVTVVVCPDVTLVGAALMDSAVVRFTPDG